MDWEPTLPEAPKAVNSAIEVAPARPTSRLLEAMTSAMFLM